MGQKTEAVMAVWRMSAIDVLEDKDEAACLAFIRNGNSGGGSGRVRLIEGELTAIEALTYAKTMLELGRWHEARELVDAVIAAEITQNRAGWTSELLEKAVA